MLFTSVFTLTLAAVTMAAPAPVELEDRATGFESISIGLTVVINAYRTNPSFDNRLNLCRFSNGFSQTQRANALRYGFNFNGVQCPTTFDQLNNIQAGLGQAYQQWSRNQNDPTLTAALCAITTQLTQTQRNRITALGININVQCLTIRQQLENIQDGLGQAYQQYTRNPSTQNTANLCAITTQLTRAQRNQIAALNINLNVQCPVNVNQRLNAIAPGLSAAYNALVAAPTTPANQFAFCTITQGLNARQTSQLQALNLQTGNLQCQNVILRSRLNNILAGLGDAYYNWNISRSQADLTTLCGLTAQLNTRQKNRLITLGVDVSTFGCNA